MNESNKALRDKVKILLVDDRPDNLLALESILDEPHYELILASSGFEALTALRCHSFAIILLDVMMPQMDGFEVARQAKTIELNQNTPIIFVTAIATETGSITRGYTYGAADYLTKPLDSDEVRAKVSFFVELYQQKRQLEDTELKLRTLNAELQERAERRAKDLAASNERFRLFVEGVKEYGFIQMDEKGRFITWNAGAERLLGYAAHEIIGLPFAEIFTLADIAAGAPAKELQIAQTKGKADDTRWHRRKDGSLFWAHGVTTALFHGNGKLRGFAKVLRDYTDSKRAEEALKHSESQLRLVTDSVPALVFYLDSEQRYKFANGAYKEWLNFDPESIYGKHILDVFGESFYSENLACLETALTGVPVTFETEIKLSNDESRFVRGSYTPDQDHCGEINGVVGMMLDITEHKKAELSLEESRRQLAHIQLASEVAGWMWIVGSEDVVWSGATEKVFGCKPSTLAAFRQLIHPEDLRRAVKSLAQLTNHQDEYQVEFRIIWPDGSIRWIMNKGRVTPSGGETIRVFGISIDITARKNAEEKLKESESNFRLLAETMPQIVFTMSANGEISYVNQRWRDYTGLAPGASCESGWLSAIHPDDLRSIEHKWREASLTGEGFEAEHRLRDKNGTYKWFLCRAVAVFGDDGKIRRWLGTSTDIEDQKRAHESLEQARKAAEKANRAKTQFLANMSHELRTPLNAILGFAEFLDEDNLSEEDRRNFGSIIRRNGRVLGQLIDDILDLSKVEAGKLIIESTKCRLPLILDDIMTLFSRQAREKGIHLSMRSDGNVPEFITTDPTRLKQILINIVGNAIKFTSHGSVSLTVKHIALTTEDGSSQLIFSVKDTGRGISSVQAATLFQPFTQADASTTRVYGGTGLGLTLSRRLAEALGGTIELTESSLEKGSTFTIRVSTSIVEGCTIIGTQGTCQDEGLNTLRSNKTLAGLRILVAEDSIDSRHLIDRLLKGGGAEVEHAVDGAEALEKTLAYDPDVVLMDIQMPKLSGLEATSQLRRRGYIKPIIALTAYAMMEERERCLQAGATDHLGKPVNITALVHKIMMHTNASATGWNDGDTQ